MGEGIPRENYPDLHTILTNPDITISFEFSDGSRNLLERV